MPVPSPIFFISLANSVTISAALTDILNKKYHTIKRICLFTDDFYSDSTLILTTVAVKQCMDIGSRPHVCGVF
jgi:hypothetical protein